MSCIKDLIDARDFMYESMLQLIFGDNKTSVDLRNKYMPEVTSQGKLGSCTLHAGGAIIEYLKNLKLSDAELKKNKKSNSYSRLFNYYLSRKMNNKEGEDYGSTLRDACKTYAKYGIVDKDLYNDNVNQFRKEPSFQALYSAADFKIEKYYRVNSGRGVMDLLHRNIPILISTNFDYFSDCDSDGLSKKILSLKSIQNGNHAMVIAGFLPGYDYYGVKRDVYILRNSHGKKWGDKGYCYLPKNIMDRYNLDDMWVIKLKERV